MNIDECLVKNSTGSQANLVTITVYRLLAAVRFQKLFRRNVVVAATRIRAKFKNSLKGW
jgi:hypothetical protein